MGYDEFYSGLQVHGAGSGGGGAARRPAIVHGHGDRDEEKLEEDLRHWFRRIAASVAAHARDRDAPRVLATTREHAALFFAACRDPQLLPDVVFGNPDHLSDGELAERAWPLVHAALERHLQEDLDRWRELLGSARATGDVGTVLRLAGLGRVQTLFLPVGAQLWGTFDAPSGRLDLHVERKPGDEELLERAAIETLDHGGEVHELAHLAALDGAPLAGLLRW
jgi:hypothetical protein